RKTELIEYMGWRSGERTMQTYEHLRRRERFLAQLGRIHQEMDRRDNRFLKSSSIEGQPTVAVQAEQHLAFMLGADNGDPTRSHCTSACGNGSRMATVQAGSDGADCSTL